MCRGFGCRGLKNNFRGVLGAETSGKEVWPVKG